MTDWEELGRVAPERLAAARLQIHWAVQAASAPGKLLLPHQPDFSEQSLEWRAAAGALAQGGIGAAGAVAGGAAAGAAAAPPLRSALRLVPPALVLLGEGDGEVLAEMPLEGRTLEEAFCWLEREIEGRLGRPLPMPLERAAALPAHPFGSGAPFMAGYGGDDDDGEGDGERDGAGSGGGGAGSGGEGDGFAELARLFGNADGLLRRWVRRAGFSAAVRCWPHHFDLAVLVRLDGEEAAAAAGEAARTLGAGMVPGDAARPHPYLYVTPWPYPRREASALPPLPAGGSWNTEGWFGAVLAAPQFIGAGPAAAQAGRAEEFLAAAAAACRELLEEGR